MSSRRGRKENNYWESSNGSLSRIFFFLWPDEKAEKFIG